MTLRENLIESLINEGVPSSKQESLLFHQVIAPTSEGQTAQLAPTSDTASEKMSEPPTDLSDGAKLMARALDPAAAIGGSVYWSNKFFSGETKSLVEELSSLNRVSHTQAYKDFFQNAPRFADKVSAEAEQHLSKLQALQKNRPDLFRDVKISDNITLKDPQFKLMSDAEKEIVHRRSDWGGFEKRFSKVRAIDNYESFQEGLKEIKGLAREPEAIKRGLAPGASKIEGFALELEQTLAIDSKLKYKAFDALKGKNIAGVLGGMAADAAIEHFVLPNSAPGPVTVAADALSPAVVFLPISPVAKAATIVTAHGVGRAIDYLFSSKSQ